MPTALTVARRLEQTLKRAETRVTILVKMLEKGEAPPTGEKVRYVLEDDLRQAQRQLKQLIKILGK